MITAVENYAPDWGMFKIRSMYEYMLKDVSLESLTIGNMDALTNSGGSGVNESNYVVHRISGEIDLKGDNGGHVFGDARCPVYRESTKNARRIESIWERVVEAIKKMKRKCSICDRVQNKWREI